jgi:hypothetical protein
VERRLEKYDVHVSDAVDGRAGGEEEHQDANAAAHRLASLPLSG